MEEIMEHFGSGFLQLIGAVLFLGIFVLCIRSGGVLSNVVQAFMTGLCG